jgi:outer membrane cobalamin receptor
MLAKAAATEHCLREYLNHKHILFSKIQEGSDEAVKAKRKKKLALIASCMMLYSSWSPIAIADEQDNDNVAVEDVEVTDSKLKERKPVQTTTINSDEIKAQGAQNAAQVLKNVAGVDINSSNTSGKVTVQIRGSDANNTKVFIDGVPLSPVANGTVDLSSIPTDSIEKLEVIKGAAPVIYGSDASGGVIYITTKKGTASGGSISTSIGSWNTQTQSGTASGSDKNVNYFFNYKNELTDGYTAHTKKHADYYTGKFGVTLDDKSSVNLFGSYSRKEEELANRYDENGKLMVNPGGTGGTVAGHGTDDTSQNPWYGAYNLRYAPIINWYSGLTYNYKLNDNNDLALTLFKSAEDNTELAVKGSYTAADEIKMLQKWYGAVNGYDLRHTVKLSSVNTVTWGMGQELKNFDEEIDIPHLSENLGTVVMASYHTVDFKLSKELKNREYYVKLNNLFDKKYYSGVYLVAPGRYVELGTDIKF